MSLSWALEVDGVEIFKVLNHSKAQTHKAANLALLG